MLSNICNIYTQLKDFLVTKTLSFDQSSVRLLQALFSTWTLSFVLYFIVEETETSVLLIQFYPASKLFLSSLQHSKVASCGEN